VPRSSKARCASPSMEKGGRGRGSEAARDAPPVGRPGAGEPTARLRCGARCRERPHPGSAPERELREVAKVAVLQPRTDLRSVLHERTVLVRGGSSVAAVLSGTFRPR
jgi:hypothetical protein